MLISQTTASISLTDTAASFVALLVFGGVLQLRQTLVPEIAEKRAKLRQTLRTGAVQTPCTCTPLLDESRLAQDAQVLRDGRTGDVGKARGDLAGRILPFSDETQDGDAARLAEGVEESGSGIAQRFLFKRILPEASTQVQC